MKKLYRSSQSQIGAPQIAWLWPFPATTGIVTHNHAVLRALLLSGLLLTSGSSWGQAPGGNPEPTDSIEVDAAGSGDTPENAKKDMVLNALRSATSTYVKSEELIVNDEVQARYASFNEGLAMKITATTTPSGVHGLWMAKGKVTVVKKNLLDSLANANVTLNGVIRSDDLLARSISLKNLQQESSNLLAMLMEEDPRRYRATASDIIPVRVDSLTGQEARQGLNWFVVKVEVVPDNRLYRDEYCPRILKILDSITDSGSRCERAFTNRNLIPGHVWPKASGSDDGGNLSGSTISGAGFAGLTIGWQPKPELGHVYRELFFKEATLFARKVNRLPSMSSEVIWYTGSCNGPFTGYNVNIVALDRNGFPYLRQFTVAPAFFIPFADVLRNRKGGKYGARLVNLKLLRKDQQCIKEVTHPLPIGNWVSPYVWAGVEKSRTDPDAVFLMPVGLVPQVCGMVGVQRTIRGNRVFETKTVSNSFTTITSATVSFRFHLEDSELAGLAGMRVTVGD